MRSDAITKNARTFRTAGYKCHLQTNLVMVFICAGVFIDKFTSFLGFNPIPIKRPARYLLSKNNAPPGVNNY
jgi:hypothetical protein